VHTLYHVFLCTVLLPVLGMLILCGLLPHEIIIIIIIIIELLLLLLTTIELSVGGSNSSEQKGTPCETDEETCHAEWSLSPDRPETHPNYMADRAHVFL